MSTPYLDFLGSKMTWYTTCSVTVKIFYLNEDYLRNAVSKVDERLVI